MSEGRNYKFSWDLIGDIETGRPNLGRTTRLEIYRLMQFTFRDVIEEHFGTEMANRVFYEAGMLSGKEFFRHFLADVRTFDELIRRLTETLSKMGIAILRFEKTDLEAGRFVITMSEDLDCSGLPEMDFEICTYDEGFIAGILESFLGTPFHVREVDCWCTGDRTCRFRAELAR